MSIGKLDLHGNAIALVHLDLRDDKNVPQLGEMIEQKSRRFFVCSEYDLRFERRTDLLLRTSCFERFQHLIADGKNAFPSFKKRTFRAFANCRKLSQVHRC